jgi:hypothetical protein
MVTELIITLIKSVTFIINEGDNVFLMKLFSFVVTIDWPRFHDFGIKNVLWVRWIRERKKEKNEWGKWDEKKKRNDE